MKAIRIPARSGLALELRRHQLLRVSDPFGEQVADLIAFSLADRREMLSSGRTIDYNATIRLTKGHVLYSNRSNPMLTIVEDTVGRHDFLLAPCSQEMFRKLHGVERYHPSCFENLSRSLARFGIQADAIGTSFNVFMNVAVDDESGEVRVLPPKSRRGDYVVFRAEMDLAVGITACSAEETNKGTLTPIDVGVGDPTAG